MADTVTTHRGLTKIEIGASDNTWGQKLNDNFDALDLALAGTLTKSTTSGTITLTAAEHGYSRIRLNGTLVGNLTVEFDGTHGGVWIIDNDTAGAFSVTVKVTGQTGVVIPQGSNRLVFFNGTDIEELGSPAADADLTSWAAITRASGFDTFVATPSSANLRGLLTDETGTGAAVFASSPTLVDPIITGTILEDIYTITDGAAFEINPGNGSVQFITLTASRTPLATNFAAGESVTLHVADGSAYTITWSGVGVVWVGGSAPTLATSGYTVIVLWKTGSVIRGAHVGDVAS